VNVATRITVATALVVAFASATYASFDLRARVAERRGSVDREARAVANTLRVSFEALAADAVRDARYRADSLSRDIVAIDQKLGIPVDPAQPANPVAPTVSAPTPEKTEWLRQRAELVTRMLAARGAAGLMRPVDLALAYKPPSEDRLRELGRASGGWRITVLPRSMADRTTDGSTPPPGMQTAASAAAASTGNVKPAQLRRLTTLTDVPQLTFSDVEDDDNYFYALALRSGGEREQDRIVLGMLELGRPSTAFASNADDYSRAVILVLLIVAVTTVVVGALASRFVSRPITKLLSGIDDVAKGDLSHVILSERDDEIGAIATRFNEMTFSLRESRTETQRSTEGKLALEQRLGQTEKLATIGQLAAEIAHEVGTPLNVIAGRARSIQKKSKDPEAVEKNAEIVAEQTARITRIIQRLLDFTRRKVGAHERKAVNLDDLAQTTIELLAGQFSHAKVKTRIDKESNLPKIPGDSDRLQQVLINLLLNAVQAMPDGGSVSVESRVVERTRPGLESAADQKFVRWSVADTGIGIPTDVKDKIFDPFYTTKEGKGGTGLGLAVCSGIVKEHDGWIEVEDGAPHGTVFRVYLPV
jgi:signal transduction histidine kinase